MTPPEAIRAAVEAALEATFGRPARIRRSSAVSGGCISPSARIETEAGDVAFLKWSGTEGAPRGLFATEAASLKALAGSRTVRVPAVLAVQDEAPPGGPGSDSDGPFSDPGGPGGEHGDAGGRSGAGAAPERESWLLLEWLEPGRPGPGGWDRLGSGLAALHRSADGAGGSATRRFGWETDNYIGTLPQRNAWTESWPEFWRSRRLEPQLRLAYDAGHFRSPDRRRFEVVLDRLDDLLGPIADERPALLHGDLWSGNVHFLADGSPAVVDPASYRGHREIDLAMSELFGGFGSPFYRAYDTAWPLVPGYAATRRPLYQLYFLLVHVNMFGGGYAASTLDALRRIPV